MNPLTLVKRTQQINSREAALGISEDASWHAKYKESAYVYVGGLPFELTEGDLLAVFAQYGEIVDVNLVRDKGTGKSKGFSFIAYEDQRSTNLAVDNLNGAQVLGRIIRVDHVSNYKKKEEEDEETVRQKREERGVCRAFQRGQCTYGDGCKFSHDEQRAANTGWGHEDARNSKWGHDKFDGPKRSEKRSDDTPFNRMPEPVVRELTERDSSSRAKRNESKQNERRGEKRHGYENYGAKSREYRNEREEKKLRKHNDDIYVSKSREDHARKEEMRGRRCDNEEPEPNSREIRESKEENRGRKHSDIEFEPKSRDGNDRREDRRSRRHISDSHQREGREKSGRYKDASSGNYRVKDRDRER